MNILELFRQFGIIILELFRQFGIIILELFRQFGFVYPTTLKNKLNTNEKIVVHFIKLSPITLYHLKQ
jgi:hypothetical protein